MLKKTLLLDTKALISSVVIAFLLVYFGFEDNHGLNYILITIVFLTVSVIVTKIGTDEKKKIGVYEHMRSWENVVANGIIPILCLALNSTNAFVGAIAGITADKFASELGVFGGDPIYLGTLKKAKRGTNGAVSWFGLLMSYFGGMLIGLSWCFLIGDFNSYKILTIGLCGFIGSFGDSIAGIFEEKGIGNKFTSNVIGAIFGAIASFYIL